MKTIKERMKKQRINKNVDINKHYTPEDVVLECLSILDLKDKSVLDVGAGLNMVWYNNLDCKSKDWAEIDKGKDFFTYDKKVDWCICNPPYKDLWTYISKTMDISNEGFSFLMAVDFWNRLTKKRLNEMKEKGFNISNIYVLEVKKWFGRYFFVTFTKNGTYLNWKHKKGSFSEVNK
jgi:hypothetical protein